VNWYIKANSENLFLYHGTNEGRARQIAKHGLLSGLNSKNTTSKEIFLSNSEQYAQSYADRKGGSTGVILRIRKTPEMIADANTGLQGDFKTIQTILPEMIEIKTLNGWKKLLGFYDNELV